MDEGLLNDLLECSVCLERLDTSSKVLPCQHTFCKKCLEEIVQKHKELRCPECRILVNIKVEDLPPNVLLMRILEGMRNAVPKKLQRSNRGSPNHNTQNVLHSFPLQQQHGTPEHRINTTKQSSPHTIHHQPYAKALFDYNAKEPGDLSFKRGDIIILKKKIDANWYQGECGGKQGVFPQSYVHVITPIPSHMPQCKALYDFRMTNDEEEGCLAFRKGDIINVIRRVDENWAEGKLDGKIGIFPLAFVEMNNLARSLMKLSSNAQPGPSRLAPPTPTTEDSTPLIPTDHTRNVVAQQPVQNSSPHIQVAIQQQSMVTSDSSSTVSSGSSTTPNISSSNTSSSSSTAPSSPASPPPRTQPVPPKSVVQKPELPTPKSAAAAQCLGASAGHIRPEVQSSHHRHNKEKRHSFTGLSQQVPHHHPTNSHRHSVELLPDEGSSNSVSVTSQHGERTRRSGHGDIMLPKAYIALYPYKPQKPDELELRKGGIYMVTERCQDGWFKGTSNRTQKTGVFPGNYVALARGGPTSWDGTAPTQSNDSSKQSGPKDRKDKGTVGLMRRLASMKRSKSPPASTYSIDNPVFEDVTAASSSPTHPVHVRSGSCPSQLLQIQPTEHHRLFGSSSQRHKHKERPSLLAHRNENTASSSSSSPDIHRHRKSNSLDAGKPKTGTQTVRERFRCIAPYPPNSEYELELQVGDIIYVHKKREDGWYKGTQQRTGRTGLFPASFVENF
ncbi:E3 ubiquitin-protein ligase SH3RF1 isoform X3 [Aethina tumida]|uniref:E3 ubiquitin-protein ligase SH3RF1 isoform X3 n=1 Tax=Aethina tumida TaxID=116153 RepID=UPI002149533D|nr:E3 ubiquitin-protein ligase SH3RF1 isoform X3 [Aethina tumida]